MANLWKNIKKKFSASEKTEPVVTKPEEKTVVEVNAVDVTEEEKDSLTKKGRQLASTVADKTGEAVQTGKQKLRLFTLKRNADKAMSELGGRTFELIKSGQSNVYKDGQVSMIIDRIQDIKNEIASLEAAEE